MVQFFDPTQEQEIKRRRRMAEQLQAQAKPQQTQMVGGYAVPQSGLEALAKGLSGGYGAYQGARADTMEEDLTRNRQKLMAEAIAKLETDQKGAAGLLMQDPSMLATGLGLYTDATKTDRAQIEADAKARQANIAAGIKSGALSVDADGNPIASPTGRPSLKPPTGYKWADDGVTLEAIEGGPAEKIDSGSAGKLSIIQSFNDNIPLVEKSIVNSFDPISFNLGAGDTGRARRAVREAIGGALYLKTGAAATPKEIDEQEGIYMPNSLDNLETRKKKIESLKNFLNQSGEIIKTGRGGMEPSAPPSTPPDAPNNAPPEGATATNPATGERIVFRNGQWGPL